MENLSIELNMLKEMLHSVSKDKAINLAIEQINVRKKEIDFLNLYVRYHLKKKEKKSK